MRTKILLLLTIPPHFSFFNAAAPPALYTLSLHDALPIWPTARTLGVRPGLEEGDVPAVLDADVLEPGQGGLSVTPDDEIGRAHV